MKNNIFQIKKSLNNVEKILSYHINNEEKSSFEKTFKV